MDCEKMGRIRGFEAKPPAGPRGKDPDWV